MNPDFWRGKKVLLTGHTGFKGSWLSLWLHQLGAQVRGYALAPDTEPNLFELAGVEQDILSVYADIRDAALVESNIRDFQPEIIIHMAAQPLVRRSYRDPLETIGTNVMGTAHVLEAARSSEALRALLIVTSDKCYENQEREEGYREDEPMGGDDPYSVSKGCADLITTAFRDSFFSPADYEQHKVVVASARAGNVYGGGDWSEDRLIPDAIRAMASNQPLNVRYPEAIRPWQFVLEPLRGYLLLAEQMVEQGTAFSGGWNFGPETDDEISVQGVLEELQQHFGDALRWERGEEPELHEAHVLRLNTEKAREKLQWQPQWHLQKGLEKTAHWYQEVMQTPRKARELSLQQIQEFQVNL